MSASQLVKRTQDNCLYGSPQAFDPDKDDRAKQDIAGNRRSDHDRKYFVAVIEVQK